VGAESSAGVDALVENLKVDYFEAILDFLLLNVVDKLSLLLNLVISHDSLSHLFSESKSKG
jgi:hypothetical protein